MARNWDLGRMRIQVAVLALFIVSGCARTPASDPADTQATSSVDAMVLLETGGERKLIPVERVAPEDWSRSAWMRTGTGQMKQYRTWSASPGPDRPYLFTVERRPHPPRLIVSGWPTNIEAPPRRMPELSSRSSIPDWCEEEAWVAAFYLAGVGSAPVSPAVLEYNVDGISYSLLIDPEHHVLEVEPTLTIEHSPQPGDGGTVQSIQVEIASRPPHSLPLLVAWRGDSIADASAGTPAGLRWRSPFGSAGPITRWDLYFLNGIPGMQDPLAGELSEC
jgi:hypothetical protein